MEARWKEAGPHVQLGLLDLAQDQGLVEEAEAWWILSILLRIDLELQEGLIQKLTAITRAVWDLDLEAEKESKWKDQVVSKVIENRPKVDSNNLEIGINW